MGSSNGDQNHWGGAVGNDKIVWPHDSKGKFNVKSFSTKFCEGSTDLDFTVDAIWRSMAVWLPPSLLSGWGGYQRLGSHGRYAYELKLQVD